MSTRPTCHGCGVTLRSKRQWICAACIALAEQAFRVSHRPTDEDWIAARNGVFGNMASFLAAVAAGRAMEAAA